MRISQQVYKKQQTQKNHKICNLGELQQHNFTIATVVKLLTKGLCSESGLHSLPSRSSRYPQFMEQVLNFSYEAAQIKSANGLQGKPGEPAALTIFARETPVFHHFIVILPLWPKILLPAYHKLSSCTVAVHQRFFLCV